MVLYRYNRNGLNDFRYEAKIKLDTYHVISETPKGYWILEFKWSSDKKWVSKEGKKRFAYPTEEEAYENFIARTKRCIKILDSRLTDAKLYLKAERTKEVMNYSLK